MQIFSTKKNCTWLFNSGNTQYPIPKPDIDFEKERWDAANELRGAVSENNYKNYILPDLCQAPQRTI